MVLRCDKCGELIWFEEGSEKWLYCQNCGQTTGNTTYHKKEDEDADNSRD